MRFKKEQLYLVALLVAVVLAAITAFSMTGRVNALPVIALFALGVIAGGALEGIASAMRREMRSDKGAASAPQRRGTKPIRQSERGRGRAGAGSRGGAPRSREKAQPARGRGGRSRQGSPLSEGTVKWFDETKGYGFITPENGSDDCFVHRSGIQGGMSLPEGKRVQFRVTKDDRGRRAATDVAVIPD